MFINVCIWCVCKHCVADAVHGLYAGHREISFVSIIVYIIILCTV